MKKPPNNNPKSNKKASTSSMRLALESRLLFDGAVVATAAQVMDDKATQDQAQVQDASTDPNPDSSPDFTLNSDSHSTLSGLMNDDADNHDMQPLALAPTVSTGDRNASTVLVIDSRAEDVQEILKNPPSNTDIRVIDANRDGYQQIKEILHDRGDTTQLHIQSAELGGEQWLGSSRLLSNINTKAAETLIDWGDDLSANASINFHGGQALDGKSWLNQVQTLTGGQVRWSDKDIFDGKQATSSTTGSQDSKTTTDADKEKTALAVSTTEIKAVKSLVFIDTKVENYQALLKGIDPNSTVILLDSTKNGVEQIAQEVAHYNNIDAIHIISHGNTGDLYLGSATLNLASMRGQYSDELALIGRHLSTNADILIYGCNFGQGDVGLQATNQLAALTGADIADSTNNTGAAALGGDWVLERHIGSIEASVIVDVRAQVDYQGILAALNIVANTAPVVAAGPGPTIVGTTARYANVGTIAGVGQVDLKATVTSVAAGDTNDTIVFTRNGTQPEIQLDGKANGSKVTVHWELLVTGTSTAVTADISIAVSDIDGPTLEAVAASTQFGLTSYTSDAATHLTITTVNNQVNAVGTQNENSGPLSAIKFNWANVSSVDFVYTTNVSGPRFFDHNGNGTLAFTNPVTTTLTTLDLDGNNSTATGNDYQNTFTENGTPVKIVDTDVTVTSAPSQFTGGTITLTNAQTGDQLLVSGSAGASGTLAGGIAWSRSGNTISLSGTTTPANYLIALQAITFNNTLDDPSPLDRAIQVGLFNGSTFTNVPVATIHVTPINDPPVNTVPGTQTISEDIQTAITGLSVNDPETTAPLGALATVKLTVVSGTLNVTAGGATISAGANNSATLTLSGTQAQINAALATLKYQGVSNFNGTDTLTVLSTDSLGLTDTDTVTINVTPVNDPPTASGIIPRTSVDSATTSYSVGGFFSDPDGDVLTFSATGLPPGLSISPTTGFISGTLTSNASQGGVGGVYAVSVTAKDSSNATLTRTFNWTVTNPAPTASNDTFTTLEDNPVVINVLANDNDPDGDTLAVTAINGTAIAVNGTVNVTNGVVKRNADNTLTFTPVSNYFGAISFQYTANDNQGGTVTATVTGTVSPVDDIIAFTNLGNGTVTGTDAQVNESDLAAGSTPAGAGETTIGTFNMGPDSALATTGTALSIDGAGAGTANLTKAQLTAASVGSPITVIGSNGTLSITGYSPTTGVVNYSYTLTSSANHTGNITVNDSFALVATDVEGQPNAGSLAINILDDAPVAVADVDEAISVGGNPSSKASGNVVTGIDSLLDPNNADGNADRLGADVNATPVTGVVAGTGAPVLGNVGNAIPGAFGSLTLNADGSYVYTPDFGNTTVAALLSGQSITDTYTYQITDGDGDAATATLTITIEGIPAVVGLNDGSVAGTDGSVLESDLAAGTNAVGTGEVLNGSFQLVSPTFGVKSITLAGSTILEAALLASSPGSPITIPSGSAGNGTLLITGYNASSGTVSYQYTLNTAPNSAAAISDDFSVQLTDNAGGGGNTTPVKFLKIAIIDDVPITNNDVDSVTENSGLPATGNVVTGIDTASPDSNATDGVADKLGVDGTGIGGPVTAVAAGTGTPVGGVNTGVVSTNGYGTLTMQANGDYRYVVNDANAAVNALKAGQTLFDTFTYQITDKDGDAATATLTVTINGANDTPAAVADVKTIAEDSGPATGNVLTNDSDVDTGTTLTVTQFTIVGVPGGPFPVGTPVTIPLVGDLLINSDGSYSFTPLPNFNGAVPQVAYTVSDGQASTTSTLNISVSAVNDPPVAVDDAVTTNEDTPVVLDLLANDTDPDSTDTKIIKSINNVLLTPGVAQSFIVPNGKVDITTTGVITFTPSPNYNGPTIFDYVVQDGNGGEDIGTVNVTIDPVNDKPVPTPDFKTTLEDVTLTVLAANGLLANDVDPDTGDNAPLSVTQFTVDTNGDNNPEPFNAGDTATIVGVGTLKLNSDGGYTFTPALNFNGPVPTVTYTVSDGSGAPNQTATSTLNLTISPDNDLPVATPANATALEDNPATVNLVGTDIEDAPANLTTTVTTLPPPSEGILYLADGVTPVVAGDPLTAAEATGLVFKPAPNFFGTVTIPFTVTDSKGAVSPSANAVITITDVNDPPVALSKSVNSVEDALVPVALVGSDIDGTVSSITVTQLPFPTEGILYFAGGTTPVIKDIPMTTAQAAGLIFVPTLDYNSARNDLVVIQFTVKDDDNGVSTPGTFVIDVASQNDDPIATPVSASTPEDTPVTVTLTGTDVEDVTPISVSVVSLPPASEGILYLANGITPVVPGVDYPPGNFVFKPAPNFNGPVSPIPFTVKDSVSQVSSPPAVLSLNIGSVNDTPTVASDNNTIVEDQGPAIGNVLLNDSDIDGNTLNVTQFSIPGVGTFPAGTTVTIPNVGTLVITNTGAYTFSPVANFNGDVPTVTYTVTDNSGAPNQTTTSTLDITVTPDNDPPTATPTSAIVDEDNPATVNLIGTDIEDVPANLTTAVTTLPPTTQGVLYLADGITSVVAGQPLTAAQATGLKFVPTANFNGTVIVPFTVTDSQGLVSPLANAVITINDVNDPPVAIPTSPSALEDTPVGVSLVGTDIDGTITSVTVTALPSPIQGVLYLAGGVTPVQANTVLTPAQAAGLIFKPAPNFNGPVTIPFTVADNDGATASATANISIIPVNDPPVAINASVNTPEDTNTTVSLVGTDVDGTVDGVIVTALPNPSQGLLYLADGTTPIVAGQTLTPVQAQSLVFKPALNFNGLVSIPFITVDNVGTQSVPATFVIDVAAVDDDPVAIPAVVSGPEDTPVPISLTGTDVEGPIAGVTVVNLPSPTQGVLTLANGTPVKAGIPLLPAEAATLKFLPAPNFNGSVIIPFTVTDSVGQVSSPPVNLTINIIPDNDAPVANDDGLIPTTPNTPVSGNVITGAGGGQADTDLDGNILTVTQFLIDTNGDGIPEAITVPPNGNGTAVLTNATGQPIGTLTISSSGVFNFAPAQAYDGSIPSATYTISDGTATDTAVLSFAPVPNTPPEARNDTLIKTKADTPSKGNVLTGAGGGLADSDADGDKLTVTEFTIAGVGTFTAGATAKIPGVGRIAINPDGSFSFTPNKGYTGPVPNITYTISDGTATDTAVLKFSPVPNNNSANIGALIMLANPTPPLFPADSGGQYSLSQFREFTPTWSSNEAYGPSHLSLYGNMQECDLYLTAAMRNQVVLEQQDYSFSVPPNTFCHCNPNEDLQYKATQMDGSPLPNWLHFDDKQLKFTGVPPKGAMNTEVLITAKDRYGNEAYANFKVTVNKDNAGYGSSHKLKIRSDRHAHANFVSGQHIASAGRPGFGEQLGNSGKMGRLLESRALLDMLQNL